MVNGDKTQEFRPEKGLSQWDPLSPYIFVLCVERLLHLIQEGAGSLSGGVG